MNESDFLILLQAKLDEAKSKGNVNSDIEKIQNQLDKLKVQAEIEPKSLSNIVKQLEGILNQKISISNINVDTKAGKQISANITQNIVDGINKSSSKVETETQKLAARIEDIQFKMDNGYGISQYQNQIKSLTNEFQKYGVAADTAKNYTESLQSILNEMEGLSGQKLVAQADRFEQEFKAVKISIDEAKISYDKLLQPISSSKQVNLTNKIEKWLVNNTRATKNARQELELYLQELSSGDINQEQYIKISNRLTELDTQMRNAGKLGKSLFQTLSEGAKKFTSWISATAIVMRAITSVRLMISTVKDLDTALVDLKKTAKMSTSELINFYHSANDTAKQMGVTTKEIIEQAAAWSRLGFNTADAATKMAKYSSMFATISPGMDLDSATDGLVSVMKAFKIGLEDTDEVVDGIMSKINIIGNTQAVNNGDIVDFLRRSSSAMAEANNTLEDTIALGTAMTEITRDASGAGQVLKTVSMRIRGRQTLPPYKEIYMLCA